MFEIPIHQVKSHSIYGKIKPKSESIFSPSFLEQSLKSLYAGFAFASLQYGISLLQSAIRFGGIIKYFPLSAMLGDTARDMAIIPASAEPV